MKKKLTTILILFALVAGLQFIMAPSSSLIGQTYKILVRRGLAADLPMLTAGEFGFTMDTRELYIGSSVGNIALQNAVTPEMYGAKGDGVTDDTAAIQAAIDVAELSADRVLFSKQYLFTHLTIDTGVTLAGLGWGLDSVGTGFGRTAQFALTKGSVLRCTATTGTAITMGSTISRAVINLENIAVIGPGSGTSVGIEAGVDGDTGIIGATWNNVLIGNFYQAMRAGCIEQSFFYGFHIRGTVLGFEVTAEDFNGNAFFGVELEDCQTYGLKFSAVGGSNQIIGGVCQAMGIDGFILSGSQNVVQGVRFENGDATGDDLRFASGSNLCVMRDCSNIKRSVRFDYGAFRCTIENCLFNSMSLSPNLIFDPIIVVPNFYRTLYNESISDVGGYAVSLESIKSDSFTIGANTLESTEWANLDGINQPLKTTDGPQFENIRLTDLGTGIIPYNIGMPEKLGDSPLSTDGTDVTCSGKLTVLGIQLIGGTGTTKLFSHQADALADDGTVVLPDATSGMVLVSCNAEAGMWLIQTDGTVTKISGSANTAAADTDANLCVFDSGTGATVKNRLGATGEIRIVYYYN